MQTSQVYKPYGDYRRGTPGDLKNHLVNYGVPTTTVDRLSIIVELSEFRKPEAERIITLREGKEYFGKARYFEGIEQPLFYFQNGSLMTQAIHTTEDGKMRLRLRLNLYLHNSPALVISGLVATEDLHSFIRSITRHNRLGDERYELVKNSGASFQGGSSEPNGEFIYIEFWKPVGAQAFVDYINENYVFPEEPTK